MNKLFFFISTLILCSWNLAGKEAGVLIVIPVNANYIEHYAAYELQYHLGKASGTVLPVVFEDMTAVPSGKFRFDGQPAGRFEADGKQEPVYANLKWARIYLGATKVAASISDIASLPAAGYVMKNIDGNLVIAGRDRCRRSLGSNWGADWHGTLFGVYDLLEKDFAVRWLWPGEEGEVIPSCDSIKLPVHERSGKPRFVSCSLRPIFLPGNLGWGDPANRDRMQHDQARFLLRHRFASTETWNYQHNKGDYWKRFGEKHPEYFSLLPDGSRRPLEGDKSGEYITFCVSNPALHKLIVQEWLNSPDRSEDNIPYRPFLNACENDTPGMCTCSQCRCWDAPDDRFDSSDYWSGKITPHRSRRFPLLARASWGEDGGQPLSTPPSLSDRYVHFYNALLAEARKYDPAAKVFGYAYSNYHEPPRQTRLNPGVIISNVPQLWFPYTDEMSKKFRSDWIGWFQAGAQQMVLRPNLTHAGANLPIYYAERFAADFSFAAKNGMCATYFDSLLGSWSAQGPTLYVLTRIHEHPEWTAEQILEEYYSGFGSASDAVKSYFAVWKQFSDNLSAAEVKRIELAERDPVTGNPGGGFKNYTGIAHHLFPLSLFDQAREKLEYAWQAAKGDSQTENRIRFLMLGCTDAELTVKTRIAQKQYQSDKTPENKQVFQQAFEELSQHRALAEPYNVANFGYIAARERESLQWPWKTK